MLRLFCDRCNNEIYNDGINDDGTIYYIDVTAGHVDHFRGSEMTTIKAAGVNISTALKNRRIYCEDCINYFRREFEGAE